MPVEWIIEGGDIERGQVGECGIDNSRIEPGKAGCFAERAVVGDEVRSCFGFDG